MIFNEIVQYLTSKDLVPDKQIQLFSSLSEIFIEFPIDNEPPSSAAVALSANCGAELPQAISCGLNCITSEHLPIRQIAEFLDSNYLLEPSEVINNFKNKKIPGFGHPSIKGEDPRVTYLFNKFRDLQGKHTLFATQLESRLPVSMNIGCIIASLSLDNGIEAKNCLFLPLLGRSFGWLKLYNKTKDKFNKVVPSFENIVNEN